MHNVQKIRDILKIANAYKLALGSKAITANLAGLEPTLWEEDGKYNIADIVSELKNNSFDVEMTTNGSNLLLYANKLINAGLSKCRVSIHSFDRSTYTNITGKDNLNSVLDGIKYCNESNLKIIINRTLIKGFTEDIPTGLSFIQKENLTLKLYDLWWVKRIEENYNKYYIHWSEIVKKYVLPLTISIEDKTTEFHRNRTVYNLNKGGFVDVKHFNNELHEKFEICKNCAVKSKCKETFGSYIHIFANGHLTFCNLREDIHLDLKHLLEKNISDIDLASFLSLNFDEHIGHSWKQRLQEADLRFYINETCNYKCSFPHTAKGYNSLWCLSSVRSNETWDINNYLNHNDTLESGKNLDAISFCHK
jgi:cyclic pyranopterin phosphate synthase